MIITIIIKIIVFSKILISQKKEKKEKVCLGDTFLLCLLEGPLRRACHSP
jgi:hypothetical protein